MGFGPRIGVAAQRFAVRAVNHQPVSVLFHPRACTGQRSGHGGEAVAFLDAQLIEASGDGAPFGQRCGDKQHREFIDHAGHDRGINRDAGQLRMLHPQISHRFAAHFAPVYRLDLPAHLAQHIIKPGASCVHADVFDYDT